MTVEIKLQWKQDVYYLLGTPKTPVIVQGTVQGMFINSKCEIVYILMDSHVVYTKNDKYSQGQFVKSYDAKNADIGKTVFTNKDEIKNKIREMRKSCDGKN